MKKITLHAGKLSLSQIKQILAAAVQITVSEQSQKRFVQAKQVVDDIVAQDKTTYGVNTGFGALASTKIDNAQIEELQKRLILSHACGTGVLLDQSIVRLILSLKINALAQGYSGISQQLLDALLTLLNQQCYPCIPSKGSVGASGDLAPLAHLSAVLLGRGEAHYQNEKMKAEQVLKKLNLQPLRLAAKEGLALINGTQVSTAIALQGFFQCENLLNLALLSGSLSLDAFGGKISPFDPRIHKIRGQIGQQQVVKIYYQLLKDSGFRKLTKEINRVQDPYSFRCQAQVMGACWDQLKFIGEILLREANGVTDNPLVFVEENEILSGGNFHAEPVALVCDQMANCLAEIASLSERRIAALIDESISGLPAFITKESGLNSGFMILHVTASALVSENKSLAHPASVDSIPTSANQEDHVSMATFAARRLLEMAENTATVLAVELMAATRGIELREFYQTSPVLQAVFDKVRECIPAREQDDYFADDLAAVKKFVLQEDFSAYLPNENE